MEPEEKSTLRLVLQHILALANVSGGQQLRGCAMAGVVGARTRQVMLEGTPSATPSQHTRAHTCAGIGMLWACICASPATAGCRARQSSHVYSNDVDPCEKLTDGARSCHARAPHRRSTRGPAERVSAPIAPLFGNDPPLAGPQGSSPRLIQHLPPPQAREPGRSGCPRAHRRRGQLAGTAQPALCEAGPNSRASG